MVPWDLKVSPDVRETEPPTEEEIEILRLLDPSGMYVGSGKKILKRGSRGISGCSYRTCSTRSSRWAVCQAVRLKRIGKGAVEGKDREGKAANYALVQELAAEFKKRNGSLICAELLGLRKPEGSSVPEARTEQYYAKRRVPGW